MSLWSAPPRHGTRARLCVLAVLAPLSVAATVGLVRPESTQLPPAVLAVPPAAAAESDQTPRLPVAVQAPASVSRESRPPWPGTAVLAGAGVSLADAIPARALVAYQRAETVMWHADPACHLSWQLVAAIGKVESDHGRFGGALMTGDGVVQPAIYGPRLTGQHHTSRIDDTDAGQLDDDLVFDRAVGPMQFIPSTWTVVSVDADGDGRRDPQDIDDASLAAAVYLCSGESDLSDVEGQRAAVYRYNHSTAYVDLVLQVMTAYLNSDPTVLGGYGPVFTWALPARTGFGAGGESMPTVPQPTVDVPPSQSPTSTATTGSTGTPPPSTTPSSGTTAPTTGPATSTPTATPPSSGTPSEAPGETPSEEPSEEPSETPTDTPGDTSTSSPSDSPTNSPTEESTGASGVP